MPAFEGWFDPLANPTADTATAGKHKAIAVDQYGQLRPPTHSHSLLVNIASTDQALTPPSRGIYVGGAGNIACRFAGDTADQLITGVLVGTFYPFQLSIIRKTNTTATLLIATW